MQEQLVKLEKDLGIEWQEKKLADIFSIENTLSFNKDKLVEGVDFDYVTRTSQNQGVLKTTGFVNNENINEAGTWSLGLLQMDFFYRDKPWYAGQFVRLVRPKFKFNRDVALYFSTIMNKQKKRLLSGLVRDVDEAFLNTKVNIPFKNNRIAFDYMEQFIATLKAERVATLKAYLEVTGLDNYHLTEEEQELLDNIDNLESKYGIEWKEFRLDGLFGRSSRGRRLKSFDRINGALPFVTAGEANMGISAYIGNNVHTFPPNTITIDMFGSAKYRNYEYGADDHVAVVHSNHLPELVVLYITTAIHKSSHSGKFDYSRNFYASDADELLIQLPISSSNLAIDFMKTYISVVKKQVIKDVVLFTDQEIKLTDQLSIHSH